MRQLKITRAPATPEQQADELAQWHQLCTTGLLPSNAAMQAQLAESAKWVISLTRQYQNRGLSQAELLLVAHRALVIQLSRHPPQAIRFLNLLVRNALIQATGS